MNAKQLVKASEFQLQYARAKKFFPRDTERMILMRIASKYYSSLDEVKEIVSFIQSIDKSKPFDKVDLYTAKKEYMESLDKKEKDAKKAKEDTADKYTEQCTVYNTTVNEYNVANVQAEDRKTKKLLLWGALGIGALMLFFGIGGLAGIGTMLASLNLVNTLGLAAGVMGVLAGKRMYDTRVKPKKVTELADKEKKLAELKAKVPEEKKKRDDLQAEKTNTETAYNDAVAKKRSENAAIAGFKEESLVNELAEQAIDEIEQRTNAFMSTADEVAKRSAISWKNRYVQMIGKWVDDSVVSRAEHFDAIVSHFDADLAQVSADSTHDATKASANADISFGGRNVTKPDSAAIESSF